MRLRRFDLGFVRARAFGSRVDYLRLLSHAKTTARQVGHTITERTLKRWPPSGRAFPSKKSLAQLEAAYLQVRRHSVARHLLQRLNMDGRGTRVEFPPQPVPGEPATPRCRYPHLQARDCRSRCRHPGRHGRCRRRGRWFDGIAIDLGFGYGVYKYVAVIGFAA
ncbi:transcriptional regulator [Streptomyces sp. NPDC048641]|uniref:transcriptional regulator n=1 Tax=Streptomyces sp. NPDC048641 TaxID=3154825 RepID=UPI0034270882